ncbi:MAG: right-handed parallel beta-helix repeat-containing protein [Candidatus Limnocylindrus sp.]
MATAMVVGYVGIPDAVRAVDPVTHWVAVSGDESGTGSSCTDPGYVGTTQAVIVEAVEAAAEGDTIHICSGKYLYGADVDFSDSIPDNVTIEGDGPTSTILDGARTFFVLAFDHVSGIWIRDIGIYRGYDDLGGGVWIGQSDFTLDNVRFMWNHAGTDGGGALYVTESTGVVQNSYFRGNGSEWGGAIVSEGSELDVTNSIFQANYTDLQVDDTQPDYGGAAIYVYGGSVHVSGSDFLNNRTSNYSAGGAIHLFSGSLHVENSRFLRNSAYQGGAIFLYGDALDYDDGEIGRAHV